MDNEKTISAKSLFVHRLADKGYTKEQALSIYNIFVEILTDNLFKGHTVRLQNFGTFRLKYHNGHRSVCLGNEIDGYLMVKFRGSSSFYRNLRSNKPLLEKIRHKNMTKKETKYVDETKAVVSSTLDDNFSDSMC